MWNVRLFYNTGLNSINIADKPSRLASAQYIDLPALDILQGEGLESVSVKATRAQVKNVDFMQLTDTESGDIFYYSVNGFKMTSVDVASLGITLDALLTLSQRTNGIENITFLDGITERHHVAKADDVYGAYTEEDPLLVPSKELGYAEASVFNLPAGTNQTLIVESLVDLDKAGTSTDAVVYTDPVSGEGVPVPAALETVADTTEVYPSWNSIDITTAGSAYFDRSDAKCQKGLDRVRELGLDTGTILSSFAIPSYLINIIKASGNNSRIESITGQQFHNDLTGLPFEYANVRNKRVLYGSTSAYMIFSTASGQSMSFKPEDLYTAGATAPTIYCDVDARAKGHPIYRFRYFKGIDVIKNNFFQNAVYGMEWAEAPLVYTGQSGSALTELRYNTSREMAQQFYENNRKSISAEQLLDHAQVWGNMVGDMLGKGLGNGAASYPGLAIANAAQAGFQHLGDAIALTGRDTMRDFQKARLADEYNLNAQKEFQELKIATTIQAPDIHFPRSETMRDFLGNGLYVIQYRIQASDLRKLDKILDMYGYKDTKPIEASDFTNRSKFNFVKANNITIGGNHPKWLREAAAAQLGAGVRVWHQLPDVAAYTDGSNV